MVQGLPPEIHSGAKGFTLTAYNKLKYYAEIQIEDKAQKKKDDEPHRKKTIYGMQAITFQYERVMQEPGKATLDMIDLLVRFEWALEPAKRQDFATIRSEVEQREKASMQRKKRKLADVAASSSSKAEEADALAFKKASRMFGGE